MNESGPPALDDSEMAVAPDHRGRILAPSPDLLGGEANEKLEESICCRAGHNDVRASHGHGHGAPDADKAALLLRALATAKNHESAIVFREACKEGRCFVAWSVKCVDNVPFAKPKLPFDACSLDRLALEPHHAKVALGKQDFVVR